MAEKEVKPIDKADVAEQIDTIVSFLEAVASSREGINRIVKYLKDTYGLSPSSVRAAANILHKQNREQVTEKEQEIDTLLDICDK